MNVNSADNGCQLKKIVLHPGTGELPYPNGTKVKFHLKSEALLCDAFPTWPPTSPTLQGPEYEGQLVDDSRNWKQPVELLLGKKFKMEVWEECINSMKKGEIAIFLIDKKLVYEYPIVSQTLRKVHSKETPAAPAKEASSGHRCCGMGAKEGLGHADLDRLVSNPRHMKFTLELVNVELPGCYEKQFWEMSEDERLSSVHELKEEGNQLYKRGDHKQAAAKYSEAIGRIDNLMLKEKPHDVDWQALNDHKTPLLLNFSQCQLLLGDYYSVVEHCTTVLDQDPDNVKALFRRGKAHCSLMDSSEARVDLARCVELDAGITTLANKLLTELTLNEKTSNDRDKKTYANLFAKNN